MQRSENKCRVRAVAMEYVQLLLDKHRTLLKVVVVIAPVVVQDHAKDARELIIPHHHQPVAVNQIVAVDAKLIAVSNAPMVVPVAILDAVVSAIRVAENAALRALHVVLHVVANLVLVAVVLVAMIAILFVQAIAVPFVKSNQVCRALLVAIHAKLWQLQIIQSNA